MRTFTLDGADVRVLLSHLALYGLAGILQQSGADDVRIGWTSGGRPRPWVGASDMDVGAAVRAHAAARAEPDSWVQRDVELKGTARGLMSPRLTTLGSEEVWGRLQAARHRELDELTDRHAWADLGYLAALGEPCYWRRNPQGEILQDDGAGRLEMQPRNQGSEFVGSRLRKIAAAVAARDAAAVVSGLDGTAARDESGSDKVDSRTATGLAAPGPTDNALAWCALWGIGQVPVVYRTGAAARTSVHNGPSHEGWFHAPVWTKAWRPARLRSILAAAPLATAAGAGLPPRRSPEPDDLLAAQRWLAARGVDGIIRFPVARFGSANAPERRAMRGETVALDGVPR